MARRWWDEFIGRDADPILGPPPALFAIVGAGAIVVILIAWWLGL